jgi:hypothetical protein
VQCGKVGRVLAVELNWFGIAGVLMMYTSCLCVMFYSFRHIF